MAEPRSNLLGSLQAKHGRLPSSSRTPAGPPGLFKDRKRPSKEASGSPTHKARSQDAGLNFPMITDAEAGMNAPVASGGTSQLGGNSQLATPNRSRPQTPPSSLAIVQAPAAQTMVPGLQSPGPAGVIIIILCMVPTYHTYRLLRLNKLTSGIRPVEHRRIEMEPSTTALLSHGRQEL